MDRSQVKDTTRGDASSERENVLTKAVQKAAEWLGVKGSELASILGKSEATTSRMKVGEYHLKEGEKSFEIGAMFVRIYRSLYAILGGDDVSAKDWIRRSNTALRGKPIELMKTIRGINEVCDYLDARRAIV